MKATLKRMKESHEFEKKMPNGGWEKKKQIVVEKMMMSHSNLEYVLEQLQFKKGSRQNFAQ